MIIKDPRITARASPIFLIFILYTALLRVPMINDHPIALSLRPYVAGGSAAIISSLIIHPIDLVSVRLHVNRIEIESNSSGLAVARNVVKREGFRGFYAGVTASFARQLVYGTAKVGLHDSFSQKLKKLNNDQPLPFYQKVFAASSAGILAALMGNPFDIVLVRMEADGCAMTGECRGYNGILNAIHRIGKEEGFRTLWRGSTPMVFRTVAMNVGMLASYDQIKEFLVPLTGSGMKNNLLASALSSFVCCFTSLPFDMMKTKLMNMHYDSKKREYPYKNIWDCAVKTITRGGVSSLWRGYWTFYSRTAPQSMITLLAKDLFTAVYTDAFCN